jgi:hypothetical protein
LNIKGDLLIKVLDYGESHQGKGAYLQRSKNSNKENGKWLINKKPVDSNKNYRLITTDYLLKGFDIPFLKEGEKGVSKINKPQNNDIRSDIRKVVIEYLRFTKKTLK